MPRVRRGPGGPRSRLAGKGTRGQPKAKGKGDGKGHEKSMTTKRKGY